MNTSLGTILHCPRCGYEHRRPMVSVDRVNDVRRVLKEFEDLASDKRRAVTGESLVDAVRKALDPPVRTGVLR